MAKRKTSTFEVHRVGQKKVHRDGQRGEFITSRPRKPYAPLDNIKRDVEKQSSLPVRDTKTGLSNAISEAVRDDVQKSKSLTIKEAKQHRRDVIVKTIMRHSRQS